MTLFIIATLVILQIEVGLGFLMYPPNSTSLGLTASVSVPITEYLPERRIIFDWCFAMGYTLPASPEQFYSAPIWPGIPGTKTKRDTMDNGWNLYENYENKLLKDKRHPTDLSAGEMYEKVEDFLVSYGFHATCLLRIVCELARHPFDDRDRCAITEIVTFFLTPSLHQGFDESESLYKTVYEDAENQGFSGADCAALYSNCEVDLLTIITKVRFLNE